MVASLGRWSVDGVASDGQEIHVLELGGHGRKPAPGEVRREHADLVLAAHEVAAHHLELRFDRLQFVLAASTRATRSGRAARRGIRWARPRAAPRPDAMIAMRGHSSTHVVHDVRREDDGDVASNGRQQVQKAIALGRVEAGGRLVDDDQARIGEQRLRDAEALLHAAGIRGQRFLAHVPQVGLLQQRVDHRLALAGARDALENREMVSMSIADILGYTPNSCGR